MIGTELLLGEIVDTNASYLSRGLAECGIDVFRKSTVGDNWIRIVEVLSQSLGRSDIVVISGGLGPTKDDLTRETVAAATNRPLQEDQAALQEVLEFFHRRYGDDAEVPSNNKKQAMFPHGAMIVPNRRGTAPGFILEIGAKTIIALPGVPVEMEGMFEETIQPYLKQKYQSEILVTKNLNFVGIGESNLEELVQDLIQNQSNPTIAPYASQGRLRIRLTAKAPTIEQGEALIEPVAARIAERTQDYFYGVDSETLEQVICRQLIDQGLTIALAESCTGGLVGDHITNVPGSSECFMRGYVVYSNQAKIEAIGVNPQTLEAHGAVSAETAREMAEGVRRVSQTDYGLAITGIAGPGGGTPQKPVGLVYISLAGRGKTTVERYQFIGTRRQNKNRASQAALRMLWLGTR